MTIIPKFISHAVEKCHVYYLIYSSHLFDAKWYKATYPEVRNSKRSSLAHYLKIGHRMGLDPSADFSTSLYVQAHPELSNMSICPLIHYLKVGKKLGFRTFKHIDQEETNRQWLQKEHPFLTIIVPNFNHQPFLRKRLDSIYQQSYTNYEVILLDDKSTDKSIEILQEFANRYPDKTTLLLNDTNSGSPFFQWERGLKSAKGDFVWIAESDDWCDNDFVEKLLPEFADESVMLAFSRTDFMSEDKVSWNIESYLSDIAPGQFHYSFKLPAHTCVQRFFSKKNIIPNVSSCIFRCPTDLKLFQDQQWNHMKVCGDWIFYLHIIRGGQIAYSTRTTNYYRQHQTNTSVKLHSEDRFYQEHQIVREHIARLFDLSMGDMNWLVEFLRGFWKQNRVDYSDEYFQTFFPSQSILHSKRERKPNLAICTFSFSTGGGEKVPIDQANALKEAGLSITFIDCGGTQRNNFIRKKLRSDIPVVSIGWDFQRIYSLFKEYGIEYVHTHHASVDYAIAINKPEDVRQIVTLHGMYEMVPKKYLREQLPILANKVYKWLYIADKNLAVMREFNIPMHNFHKIFNAVPEASPCRSRADILAECGFTDDSCVIAIASRALLAKGWLEAYRAVALSRESTHKAINIIFVGDGELYEKMHPSSDPWAYFTGYSNDVTSYFHAADIVMLPSYYSGESFPLCLLEAFQAEKPVIATDIGEIKNMMQNECGVAGCIITLEDNVVHPEQLQHAIEKLVQDKDAYAQAQSSSKASARKYSMGKLTQELILQYC